MLGGIGNTPEPYWFTLNATSEDGIHLSAEIVPFNNGNKINIIDGNVDTCCEFQCTSNSIIKISLNEILNKLKYIKSVKINFGALSSRFSLITLQFYDEKYNLIGQTSKPMTLDFINSNVQFDLIEDCKIVSHLTITLTKNSSSIAYITISEIEFFGY